MDGVLVVCLRVCVWRGTSLISQDRMLTYVDCHETSYAESRNFSTLSRIVPYN